MCKVQYAYCGYNCEKCPVYQETKNNNLKKLKKILYNNNPNETLETLGCKGCNFSENINKICIACQIRKCAIERKISSCGLCMNFPCEKLIFISEETMNNLKKINKEGGNND